MDKNEIKAKCRKVYLPVQENRIFGEPHREHEFVHAFRCKERAFELAKEKTRYIWERDNELPAPTAVVEFYLVPANRIDESLE